MTAIVITRAGPLCTVQDRGRFGMLRHGVSASGPMDRGAFERAGAWLGGAAPAGIEFTAAGLSFRVEEGPLGAAVDGGTFTLKLNGETAPWPERLALTAGDEVAITPGPAGNYGYVRFDRQLALLPVMGSFSTNSIARLGGYEGRALRAGDGLIFEDEPVAPGSAPTLPSPAPEHDHGGTIRVLWGLHADLIAPSVRERFESTAFVISPHVDRMGARLADPAGVFTGPAALSLVSDAIVPGDIQILGDGTPIVLLRDHQPTGGYPRIATIIGPDLDRFVQMRQGTEVRFAPVTLQKAHAARGPAAR